MAVQTGQGCEFSIGPQNSVANDTTAYGLLSYTLVGEVQSLGEFGDTFNEVTFTALDDSRVRKFKGSRNAGNITLTVGLDPSDTGQGAVEVALEETNPTTSEYAFKVTLNDSAGTNPTTYYFRGKVMSFSRNVSTTDDIVTASVQVAINSDIITLDAA